MKLVNVQVIKDELERLIRNYRFYSSTEAKYRYEAYTELSEWLDGLEVKETGTVWHSFGEVLPPQGSDICVYWDRDKIITTGIWEESEKPKYASKWAYTDDLLQEPTNPFDSHIQEGDKITVNEDGSRFNRSQLERVVELSRYSKPYEAKRVKRTPADIEAAMKEIDELSKAFTEAHPEGGDQMLTEIREEYHIVDNNEMVSEELEEAASQYSFNIPSAIFNDLTPVLQNIWKREIEGAFIAGAKWYKEQLKDKGE